MILVLPFFLPTRNRIATLLRAPYGDGAPPPTGAAGNPRSSQARGHRGRTISRVMVRP
ncbi:Uncharacterised protein [Bordetella pertussis]|nr:Uncharacterised protein [Bordetella pertussis]